FTGGAPVEIGYVASWAHPGGNATGVTFYSGELEGKRMELLHELVPSATKIAFISNPNILGAKHQIQMAQEAARSFGLQLHVLNAATAEKIDAAFASMVQLKANALVVGANQFFSTRRDQFVALAAKTKVPAIYHVREFVEAGGLLSYGPSISSAYRQAGIY